MNMKLVRVVLFFGVLAVGMLAGFSIGYDHGVREAESRARIASARFFNDFKAKVAEGGIFALAGIKILPMGARQAKVCGGAGYLASVKMPGGMRGIKQMKDGTIGAN